MTANLIQRGGLMKKKTLLLVLGTFFGVLVICYPALVAAEAEPKVGLNIGDVSFSAPTTTEDATYLGLAGQNAFTLKDINSPYVLIESIHST
jgi:hypothetical protein